MRKVLTMTCRWVRRGAVAIVGGTVILIGVAMIVLPGPALIVIPAGLAILSLEFAWARHLLDRLRSAGGRMMSSASDSWSRWRRRM